MTILDGIRSNNAPFDEECLVIVNIPEKKQLLDKRMHSEYYIETTKGRISLSLNQSPFFKDLVKTYYLFEGIKVGWLSKEVVTFGPVDMSFIDFPISHESRKYNKWDIFLSFGGFDSANIHLCFSKKDHSGLYGAPDEPLNGVIGRVIQGGHIIPMLRRTDSILTFTPLTQSRKRALHLRPNELKEEFITPGMEIFTYLYATFHEEAKKSVDHFLSIINSGKFSVDEASSMFIKNGKFRGAKVPSENSVFRQNGIITVRNQGYDMGSVYIYKNDTSFSPSHNVIGRIDPNNLPLIENANPGDKILIKTFPESFNFIGKTQQYATTYLKKHNVTHKRVGDEKDDSIIVEQRPMNSMDVWLEKTCVTLGLSSSQIIRIKLFHEEAPLSIEHFRKHLKMLYFPIGRLQVLENLKKLMLFIPLSGVESIEAVPRENRVELVPEGAIGVTNALRRLTGSIGIRLVENDIYGPTGETLEGTNIIGEVKSDLKVLRKLDTGDMVWFMEVRDNE
ncbi:MAG: methanogenesis marker 3 protein [Candidatus Helarchaeota archaeon]|nr:methanogenesis marker 3 protein [Candidatus Helarchaeota archaeon]